MFSWRSFFVLTPRIVEDNCSTLWLRQLSKPDGSTALYVYLASQRTTDVKSVVFVDPTDFMSVVP